ncbi:Na(+)/H(+) antiporter subunit F1 [Bacillus sp. FJAT-49732]|uniref:Na(+)/H(+) antiporter subunit F1 n=1 Tax=Lederbergia citrisecunda TaxID=2833583 RepID=A0A942YPK1_9BACI|nr:Na(+)/H(+) antiporter subunit F1 [Lederbergia citrisecunda]MBS4201381.1 Na(+)/H(+) antiporter subunit F1 [Lederbergia citrisecunda]
MIGIMLKISLTLFALAIVISLYRIIRGPSIPDRVIAMDMIGVNLISAIAAISILLNTKAYLEVILILGILAFISTIALSKFIERGVIIEHKRDR